MQFDDTRIYQRAMELVALSREVISDLPTGYGFLADQLRRASSSIPLTFAEGYGKNGIREQRRFFAIARGSACEVAAIFDVARTMGALDERRCNQGKELCDHLARMLTLFRRRQNA